MGKAYVDFDALARLDAEGAFFVARTPSDMRDEIVFCNFNFAPSTVITGDYIIKMTG